MLKNIMKHYQNVVNDIPKYHMIIECGDFNAHLGKTEVHHMFRLLLEHSEECGLNITNTMFEKRKGKLWTFISDMNGRKSQINYILVNKKWKNSIHNVEAYNSFSSLGSDHRLVTANIRLSLRMSKTEVL